MQSLGEDDLYRLLETLEWRGYNSRRIAWMMMSGDTG